MLFGGARSARGETSPGLGYLQPHRHRSRNSRLFRIFATKYRLTRDLLFHEAAGPTRTCYLMQKQLGRRGLSARRGPVISYRGSSRADEDLLLARRGAVISCRSNRADEDLLLARRGPAISYRSSSRADEDLLARRGPVISRRSSSRANEDLLARRGPVIYFMDKRPARARTYCVPIEPLFIPGVQSIA